MKIKGKDFMEWLHQTRKENKIYREKKGISGKEWLKEISENAERILGRTIVRMKKPRSAKAR